MKVDLPNADRVNCKRAIPMMKTESLTPSMTKVNDEFKKLSKGLGINDILVSFFKATPSTDPKDLLVSANILSILIDMAKPLFLKDGAIIDIKVDRAPLFIASDLHGSFWDLWVIMQSCGLIPINCAYLFLGDYVDRSMFGLQILIYLLCLKLFYPKEIYMLRGGHENKVMNKKYGFTAEISKQYFSQPASDKKKVLSKCFEMWDCLSVVAIINNRYFCVHGGLSPIFFENKKGGCENLCTMIRSQVSLPVDTNENPLVQDLVYSDPIFDNLPDETERFEIPHQLRKVGCRFKCPEILRSFTEQYRLNIIRGNQIPFQGFTCTDAKDMWCVCSSGNVGGVARNNMAFLKMNPNNMAITPYEFVPIDIRLPQLGAKPWYYREAPYDEETCVSEILK